MAVVTSKPAHVHPLIHHPKKHSTNKIIIAFGIVLCVSLFLVSLRYNKSDECVIAERRFGPYVSTSDSEYHSCVGGLVRYEPSELETKWKELIATHHKAWRFKAPGAEQAYCEIASKFKDEFRTVLQSAFVMHKYRSVLDAEDARMQHYSHFVSVYNCSGTIKTVRSPIEPLVAFLRMPRPDCDFKTPLNNLLDRHWLLPTTAADALYAAPREPGSVNILMDLGALTYADRSGAATQPWFKTEYEKRGIQFDRILAWESANIIPERVFEGVPRDWIGRYQYYSAAAVVEPDSVRNPFTVLKTVARASDFVVVKLDLDNPVVEMAFIQQLLDDPELHKIVDEVYIETEFSFAPFFAKWNGDVYTDEQDLKFAYNIYEQLRMKGIRAHYWP